MLLKELSGKMIHGNFICILIAGKNYVTPHLWKKSGEGEENCRKKRGNSLSHGEILNLPKSNEVSNINVWRSLTGIAHSKGLCIWCMKSEDNHHKDSKTYNLHLLNQLGINTCISLS